MSVPDVNSGHRADGKDLQISLADLPISAWHTYKQGTQLPHMRVQLIFPIMLVGEAATHLSLHVKLFISSTQHTVSCLVPAGEPSERPFRRELQSSKTATLQVAKYTSLHRY